MKARLAVMTHKHLSLNTERTFRSNETAKVKINVRNIEKLTVKQYYLDLEAYFRKVHQVGGVEHLDIALISPDKQWEYQVDGYAKYRPLEQHIEIPFDLKDKKPAPGGAGVCIINISEEDLEATTLVVRSDLDLIQKYTGGSRPALESFVAFRGREPKVDALLRHNGMAPQPA